MYGAKRSGAPPMMASISGRPYRAVRTTDCGEPPTPTQVVSRPDSVFGNTSAFVQRGARVVPLQVTGFSSRSFTKSSIFSSNSMS